MTYFLINAQPIESAKAYQITQAHASPLEFRHFNLELQ